MDPKRFSKKLLQPFYDWYIGQESHTRTNRDSNGLDEINFLHRKLQAVFVSHIAQVKPGVYIPDTRSNGEIKTKATTSSFYMGIHSYLFHTKYTVLHFAFVSLTLPFLLPPIRHSFPVVPEVFTNSFPKSLVSFRLSGAWLVICAAVGRWARFGSF